MCEFELPIKSNYRPPNMYGQGTVADCLLTLANAYFYNRRLTLLAHQRGRGYSTSLRLSQATRMKIHEFQAKEILRKAGVAVPRSIVARSPEEAFAAFKELGGPLAVVKAQIHAGGSVRHRDRLLTA